MNNNTKPTIGTTTTETWEEEFMDMLTKAYWEIDEHDLREAWITKKSIDFIKELIAKEKKAVLEEIKKTIYKWGDCAACTLQEELEITLATLAHSQEDREGKDARNK